MNAFTYVNGQLYAENVCLAGLAERFGTPLYVYSKGHLCTQYRRLKEAMQAVNPLICFAVKANSNGAVLQAFAAEGSGFDIVSGGELFRAIRAGGDPKKIVFAGVGKTNAEIIYALECGILFFTVESEAEARRISQCAVEAGTKGRIAFRINPDVDPKTHHYISTGKKENKFGIDFEYALDAYAVAATLPGLEIVGLHIHIGSQILSPHPFADAISRISELCTTLRNRYDTFRYLDVGGGLGIQYERDQAALDPAIYADVVVPSLLDTGLQVVMEPGRSLSGNAGVLVCRVQYVKKNSFKKFVVVDAGMNDLLRPALYQAYHDIVPVAVNSDTFIGDLVGPICESGDFIATNRELPSVKEGDLLAVKSVGAYGFSMASTYNSRPLPAEVMVEGTHQWCIRERETWADLVRSEVDMSAL